MIAEVSGVVRATFEDRIQVSMGPWTVEVLMPRRSCMEIRQGQEVTLKTHLLIEGSGATGRLAPILIGFQTQEDLDFYELLITVKGMGTRKTLRAMAAPVDQIAMAIARGDERTLKSLPEIGATMAKRIASELKDKASQFKSAGEPVVSRKPVSDEIYLDAMDVLTQLGYKRVDAERMIDRTLREAAQLPSTSDALVQWVLKAL